MKFLFMSFVICYSSLLAHPINQFIIPNDSITLECKDVKKIKKINDFRVSVDYTQSGAKKIYDFTKQNVNKKLILIADDEIIFMNIRISEALGGKEIPKGEIIGISLSSKTGNIDKFVNTFKHCKNVIEYPKHTKKIPQDGTLDFRIGKNKLDFVCEDVKEVRGVAYKDFSFNFYFTKLGSNKLCKFTKNGVGKKMFIFLNNKAVQSNIKINEPIACDYKEDKAYLIESYFKTLEEIRSLARALCIDPNN